MDEQKNNVQMPDFSNEKMKMPENAVIQNHIQSDSDSAVNGPLLIILTLLLVVILGGMYYWFVILNTPKSAAPTLQPTQEQNSEPVSTSTPTELEAARPVSTSDEVPAIEADLEATDLDSMDAEMQAIEAELEADDQAQ